MLLYLEYLIQNFILDYKRFSGSKFKIHGNCQTKLMNSSFKLYLADKISPIILDLV